MTSSNQQLPFLPGYRIETKPRANYHKTHVFDVTQGIRVEPEREAAVIDQRSFPSNTSASLAISRVPNDFTSTLDAKYKTEGSLSKLPSWVAYDRKVLRFYGYFKEGVVSSAVEKARVRKIVLYYYLEDDSVHITEPKQENSGMPQGVYIKRHKIPKHNNEYINLNDLRVGAELAVYGRVFHLVDCDEFTRQFFDENGQCLAGPEQYPVDAFTLKQTAPVVAHNKLMNPLKNFMEASLGKQMGQDIRSTQKFLKNDGRVLRFYCLWNDSKMYGEQRPYILHYFLADDTVEVLEVRQHNSGRDAFPALLARSKLPVNHSEIAPDLSKIGRPDDENVQFLTEEMIKVGTYVNVYGRKLLVCGADNFTENFYINNYGMSPEDFPRLNMEDHKVAVPKLAPPPYTGFGTEEDSLGSFLYLMPKVPKADFKKLMENDGMNLRFLAKFSNPQSEDRDRRFLVTYYLNNDTISVFEKFKRNSGFIGGKFLERSRQKNVATSEYFKPADFAVGQRLTVNQYDFDLIEMDQYTQNFIDQNPALFGKEEAKEEQEEASL